jgi:hypothetical protein
MTANSSNVYQEQDRMLTGKGPINLDSVVSFEKLCAEVTKIDRYEWSKHLVLHDVHGPIASMPLREYRWADHSIIMQDNFSRTTDFNDTESLTRLPVTQYYLKGLGCPVYKASLMKISPGSCYLRAADQSFVNKPSRHSVLLPISLNKMLKCDINDERVALAEGELQPVDKNASLSLKNLGFDDACFLYFDIDIPNVI